MVFSFSPREKVPARADEGAHVLNCQMYADTTCSERTLIRRFAPPSPKGRRKSSARQLCLNQLGNLAHVSAASDLRFDQADDLAHFARVGRAGIGDGLGHDGIKFFA